MKRPNLQVVTEPLVRSILFDGKRAIGVEFERDGVVEHAEADRELILSAGAIGSPHIMQVSGVGATEHLTRVGIPVDHELPGSRAEPAGPLHRPHQRSGPGCVATVNERSRGIALATEVLRYLVAGKVS